MPLRVWCWLGLGLLLTPSCQGEEFSTRPMSEGGAQADGGENAAGVNVDPSVGGARASEDGGQAPSAGGGPGSAGESSGSPAGAGGTEPDAFVCEDVGKLYGGHCYVRVPGASRSAEGAVAECERAAIALGKATYLVSLETKAEQVWFEASFLEPIQSTHDAWLGLGCNEAKYPNLTECACNGCSAAELGVKRGHWTWLRGSRTDGWKTVNPNGDGRCAALSWDAVNGIAWVDRVCGDAVYVFPTDQARRDYLSVCEVEL